jgi:hypothetical protein
MSRRRYVIRVAACPHHRPLRTKHAQHSQTHRRSSLKRGVDDRTDCRTCFGREHRSKGRSEMKLTIPFLIALAPFMAAPSYALQLKPVSADVRQADRDAIRNHIDKIFQAYIAKDAATIR